MSTEMNVGGGYEQAASKPENQAMGGGEGAHGSGVAGGWDGQSGQQQQQQPAEKQDWLDKGIEFAGKKAGVNISDANADKAGDFMNKEFNQYEGRGLPGVQ
ncbi:hypothetical protein PsYK624_100640 [Phanerochaete sordida]|uniref:Uncharacterized protein n=1 Tax=Phanerochaete sordida TaxID=48140 RepID=A0A9P3GGJ3_9APHY|nr:hypothetical protein PsYK624_100640 [Phanerochaete sordida]